MVQLRLLVQSHLSIFISLHLTTLAVLLVLEQASLIPT